MKITVIPLLALLLSATTIRANRLQIKVDERIELITTIQLLSDYEYMAQGDIAYKNEVANTFAVFKDHDAVKYYKHLSQWFYGSAPLAFIVHYSLPAFQETVAFNAEDSIVLRYTEKKDSLQQFFKLLKDFYTRSNFHTFYTAHQSFYNDITAPVKAIADTKDFALVMEKHFGMASAGYHIVLSPLQMDAGFGHTLTIGKGDDQYAFVGPKNDSKGLPDFDNDVLFRDLVVHEFSHAFCNPLVDKFYTSIEKDSCLFAPVRKAMKAQGYSTWRACLYELLTRANEIVLNKIIYGKEDADKLYEQNIDDHWIYLEGLVPLIENEYLPKRTLYPTQEQLMPLVVTYFDAKAKECK
jgi:hypothetical protein